jgi:hypothetical protein
MEYNARTKERTERGGRGGLGESLMTAGSLSLLVAQVDIDDDSVDVSFD